MSEALASLNQRSNSFSDEKPGDDVEKVDVAAVDDVVIAVSLPFVYTLRYGF